MKNRKNYVMAKSNPTLTQSGLLAILLRRQRYKVIELARRRAHREQARTAFRNTLNWLLARDHGGIADRSFPFRRGFEGGVPRGTLEIFNQANSHVSPNPYLH
jgi:hypothetical protein